MHHSSRLIFGENNYRDNPSHSKLDGGSAGIFQSRPFTILEICNIQLACRTRENILSDSMNCPHCGSELLSDQEICPTCFQRVKRPGFWARLFGSQSQPSASRVIKVMEFKKTEIVTEKNGERRVYHSLDEVPPEMRAKIEEFLTRETQGQASQTIKVRDLSGREQTYHSLEELPPEMRALIQNIPQKDKPG